MWVFEAHFRCCCPLEREARVIVDGNRGPAEVAQYMDPHNSRRTQNKLLNGNFNGEITRQLPTDSWVERTAAIESFVPERNYCLPKSAARGVLLSGTK